MALVQFLTAEGTRHEVAVAPSAQLPCSEFREDAEEEEEGALGMASPSSEDGATAACAADHVADDATAVLPSRSHRAKAKVHSRIKGTVSVLITTSHVCLRVQSTSWQPPVTSCDERAHWHIGAVCRVAPEHSWFAYN